VTVSDCPGATIRQRARDLLYGALLRARYSLNLSKVSSCRIPGGTMISGSFAVVSGSFVDRSQRARHDKERAGMWPYLRVGPPGIRPGLFTLVLRVPAGRAMETVTYASQVQALSW
jgi:hypothetical protein